MTKPDFTGKEGAYRPRMWEVAGFELYGERQSDGTIRLGSPTNMGDDYRTHVREFPATVDLGDGVVYTLEFVKENHWPGRKRVEQDDPEDPRLMICWGVYV